LGRRSRPNERAEETIVLLICNRNGCGYCSIKLVTEVGVNRPGIAGGSNS